MSTGIPNVAAPPPMIYNLSHVILRYATLIPSVLHLRNCINIYKRIQNVSIPLDTEAIMILGEWVVNDLLNS